MAAPYMSGVPYTKLMQPHIPGDIRFEEPGHVGTSATVQSDKSSTHLLMITDWWKGNLNDVDDDNFIDTLPKRQKTSTYFHSPIEHQTIQEYYLTEPQAYDIHTPTEPHATNADDEPQSYSLYKSQSVHHMLTTLGHSHMLSEWLYNVQLHALEQLKRS